MVSDETLAVGVAGTVAAGAAYIAARSRSEEQQTQPTSGLSASALMALLASQNESEQSGTDVPEGEPAFHSENPADYGDTDDVLSDDGSYPDEGTASSPDDGASGEQGVTAGEYTYTGGAVEQFQRWVSGDITTEQFQSLTGQGDGTAAVVGWDGGSNPPTSQTEGERDRTFADPGLSTYVQQNPDADIGTFFPEGGYTIAQDTSRYDQYEWLVLNDEGDWIDSVPTREEAVSVAMGEAAFRSADPTQYGDRFTDDTSTSGDSTSSDDYDYDEHDDSNDYSTGDAMDDVGDGEFTSDEEADFWTGNL